MSIEIFVGGKYTKITKGSHSIYSGGDITFNAGKEVRQTGVDGGIVYGEPEKIPERETQFLIEGEWLDSERKPIKKKKQSGETNVDAKIGDKVYFKIKTKNIPKDDIVQFELRDYDGSIYIPIIFGEWEEIKTYDKILLVKTNDPGSKGIEWEVDQNGEILFGVQITDYLEKYIDRDKGNVVELYFFCKYQSKTEPWKMEWVDLPKSKDNFLNVSYGERTLFIESAVGNSKYGLPEFRSSNGDIIIFSEGVIETENNLSSEIPDGKTSLEKLGKKVESKIESEIKKKAKKEIEKGLTKFERSIAVHQLKKGNLAFTDGVVRNSKRLYTTTSFDNLGNEYTLTKASNFGFIKNGEKITSKGISQLDYFREKSIFGQLAGVGKKVLSLLSFVDLVKYMSGEGEAKLSIPMAHPALAFVGELLTGEANDQIKNMVDDVISDLIEKAKDQGVQKLKEFIDQPLAKQNKYDYREINQYTLDMILKGKIRNFEKLKNIIENKITEENTAFHQQGTQLSQKYLIVYKEYPQENVKKGDIQGNNVFIQTVFIL
ncbi:hypothetical protein CMU57_06245 [Elizabethkingia anophelis]|nr:hypothetical protein [Elizabethkingia anophelis]MDV3723797.1 hypothetical protein [Elizabethkingia anophelis]